MNHRDIIEEKITNFPFHSFCFNAFINLPRKTFPFSLSLSLYPSSSFFHPLILRLKLIVVKWRSVWSQMHFYHLRLFFLCEKYLSDKMRKIFAHRKLMKLFLGGKNEIKYECMSNRCCAVCAVVLYRRKSKIHFSNDKLKRKRN